MTKYILVLDYQVRTTPISFSSMLHTTSDILTLFVVPPRVHGGAARMLRRQGLLRDQADEPAALGQGPRQPGGQVRLGHLLQRYRGSIFEVQFDPLIVRVI